MWLPSSYHELWTPSCFLHDYGVFLKHYHRGNILIYLSNVFNCSTENLYLYCTILSFGRNMMAQSILIIYGRVESWEEDKVATFYTSSPIVIELINWTNQKCMLNFNYWSIYFITMWIIMLGKQYFEVSQVSNIW